MKFNNLEVNVPLNRINVEHWSFTSNQNWYGRVESQTQAELTSTVEVFISIVNGIAMTVYYYFNNNWSTPSQGLLSRRSRAT